MTVVNSALIATVSTQTLTGFDVATVSIVLANTEYTYTLPSGTKAFSIQNRNNGTVYLRKVSGGDYWTFFPGTPYDPMNLKSSATVTLILSSNLANQVIEVLAWN
jgi:hypothetical protein